MSNNPLTPNQKILDLIKQRSDGQNNAATEQAARTKKFEQRHKQVLSEIETWLQVYDRTIDPRLDVKSFPHNLPNSDPTSPGPIATMRIVVSAEGVPAQLTIQGRDFMHISLGDFGLIAVADRRGEANPGSFDVLWSNKEAERWGYDAFVKLLEKYLKS